jgi:hypothetical protein
MLRLLARPKITAAFCGSVTFFLLALTLASLKTGHYIVKCSGS